MSVTAMAYVFNLEGIEPTEKFVLIAYVDHADSEGRNIYPSIDRISKKTGYSVRTVQRATQSLVSMGLLIPDGTSERRTNKWHLNMSWEGVSLCQGDTVSPIGCQPVTLEGVTVTPESSLNHQESLISRGISLPAEKAVQTKRKRVNREELAKLREAFELERGVMIPTGTKPPSYIEKFWYTPLREILLLCEMDVNYAVQVIRAVVRQMRKDEMSFFQPSQIVKSVSSYVLDHPKQKVFVSNGEFIY